MPAGFVGWRAGNTRQGRVSPCGPARGITEGFARRGLWRGRQSLSPGPRSSKRVSFGLSSVPCPPHEVPRAASPPLFAGHLGGCFPIASRLRPSLGRKKPADASTPHRAEGGAQEAFPDSGSGKEGERGPPPAWSGVSTCARAGGAGTGCAAGSVCDTASRVDAHGDVPVITRRRAHGASCARRVPPVRCSSACWPKASDVSDPRAPAPRRRD